MPSTLNAFIFVPGPVPLYFTGTIDQLAPGSCSFAGLLTSQIATTTPFYANFCAGGENSADLTMNSAGPILAQCGVGIVANNYCKTVAFAGTMDEGCQFAIWGATVPLPVGIVEMIPEEVLVRLGLPLVKQKIISNIDRFKSHYATAKVYHEGTKQNLVSEDIFIKRRQACLVCPAEDKMTCGCVGCKNWQKLILREMKCPKGKW